MPKFDPIASPTVRTAEHLEPAFAHAEQSEAAKKKIAEFSARRRKRPNVLVFLMDDVGWGDFGCYGGGVAVGAPTPNFDRLARAGLQLTSCYSEPTCSPSRATLLTGRVPHRHGLHRPPMYGEPGGLTGEATLPQLLSDSGYATQAVGKWHIGENAASQPQNVGFDDFYGFLSVSDMYTEWRDPHFFPEIVYSEARTEWVKNMPFNRCFVHAKKGGTPENVEEVTIPALSLLDEKWCQYSEAFIQRMAGGKQPWLLYHCTRGAHFDNYPHERFLAASPAKHPYKDTLIELDDIVRRLTEALRATGQLEDTLIFISSDNGPHMETWPDAAYTPFRCAKGSTWEGGVRVPGIVVWPGMVEAGQQNDGLFNFSDILPTVLALAGESARLPADRYIDGVDQSAFLLAPAWPVAPQVPLLLADEHVFGAALRRVQDGAEFHQRRRCGRVGPGRIHRHPAETHLSGALQPVSRPQGNPQLHDAQARVHGGVPARHPPAPGDLQALPAQDGDGPAGGGRAREIAATVSNALFRARTRRSVTRAQPSE